MLSLIGHALLVTCFAVAGSLLGDTVSTGAAFLVGPAILLSNCLPITPGGIGLAEMVSHGLFGELGLGGGAEMMALIRVGGALLSLPGVFGMLGTLKAHRGEVSPAPDTASA
jgi:uncharacterized membrane protein YbhN (UPF0104 family)